MTKSAAVPRWLLIAAALLLLSGVVFSLERLRRYVVEQHEIVTLLAEVAGVTNRLSALEWQAISVGQVSPELRRQHDQQTDALHRKTEELEQRADAQALSDVVTNLDQYSLGVAAEFTALRAGDVALARDIDEEQVDPSFVRLGRSMERTSRLLKQDARQAEQVGQMASLAVIALALLLMVLLARAFEILAQRARTALANQARLESLEVTDSMTRLLNRSGLVRAYATLPPGQMVAVVMTDLNDLKSTNDAGGHSAGDALLLRVASVLRGSLPPDALIARWGGDEFLILLPGMDRKSAAASMNAVLKQLGSSREQQITFAFGVSETWSGDPLERPLAVADAAMYDHKERVRGTILLEQGSGANSVEDFVARLATFTLEAEILNVALPMARALLGFDVLLYVERQGAGYEIRGFDSSGLRLPADLFRGSGAPFAGGVIAAALNSRQTSWSNDYAADPRALKNLNYQVKSCGASPMICRGSAEGAVVIGHLSTWRPITPQVRRVLESLALHLADVRERRLMVGELRQALEGGQKALGIALELRDLETAGHTERVVELAGELGRVLNLPPECQAQLRQGAYLHDLGKLTVPDAVLLKPGRFTPEEREIMQSHAQRGYEIASQIAGLPQGTLDVIRFHHEKWDGSGYPDRLAGESIPLLARIFAVCDVYDALTCIRPYKPAWTCQDAVAEIRAQAGRHFDPEVVQGFLNLDLSPLPASKVPDMHPQLSS
jgi:diguanylate cyclase (GGDEF)-like protein